MERSGSTGSFGSTGNGTGNGTGSGRAAPPGGAGRALLCLALLLLLLPPAWALPTAARPLTTAARPLPTAARPLTTAARPLTTAARRLRGSWELLEAANATLHRLQELSALGFECTLEEVDLKDITENQINTIKACTAEDPGPGNCPALEESTFDEGKCLQGISADLRAYRAELSKLKDPQVLKALDAMMKAVGSSTENAVEAPMGSGSILGSELESFSERLRLCGVLQAFLIRSVTISRMMNFLSSLENPGIQPES